MRSFGLLVLLAASAVNASVAPGGDYSPPADVIVDEDPISGTTTLTSTTTMTYTVTECPPDVPDCPAHMATAVATTTEEAIPTTTPCTWGVHNSTFVAPTAPSSKVPVPIKPTIGLEPSSTSGNRPVPTGGQQFAGAGSTFVNTGLLAGALALGLLALN
jgi:hypothetical protein